MPFKSKAQQRWMFAAESRGELPEGTARRWAHETPSIKKLPEKVKPKKETTKKAGVQIGYVAKKLREQLGSTGTHKNLFDAVQSERDRERRKHSEFVEFCTKIAFSVPRAGQVTMTPRHIGSFTGQATTNFLKAPGAAASTHVVNPRLSVSNAMTKTTRA